MKKLLLVHLFHLCIYPPFLSFHTCPPDVTIEFPVSWHHLTHSFSLTAAPHSQTAIGHFLLGHLRFPVASDAYSLLLRVCTCLDDTADFFTKTLMAAQL